MSDFELRSDDGPTTPEAPAPPPPGWAECWEEILRLWPKWEPNQAIASLWETEFREARPIELLDAIRRVRLKYSSDRIEIKWVVESLSLVVRDRREAAREAGGETVFVRRPRAAVHEFRSILGPMLREVGAPEEAIVGAACKAIADKVSLDALRSCAASAEDRHPYSAAERWSDVRRWLSGHVSSGPQDVELTEVVSINPADEAEERRTLARADAQLAHERGVRWPPPRIPGEATAHSVGECERSECWQCAMGVGRGGLDS